MKTKSIYGMNRKSKTEIVNSECNQSTQWASTMEWCGGKGGTGGPVGGLDQVGGRARIWHLDPNPNPLLGQPQSE